MSTNFDSRLLSLKQRRQGTNQGFLGNESLALDSVYKHQLEESYEKRALNKATRYALGALQEVDPGYTQNSYVQGNRVKNQLEKGLQGEVSIAFQYQGSVPLNVHIRRTSDVDLLVIRTEFVTIDPTGPKYLRGGYSSWHGESPPQLLGSLRTRSTSLLRLAFPEAEVDASGSKSIAMRGGSLTRKIDVVPSHWHDTANYQQTGEQKDRGICILDTSKGETVQNYPFFHMHQINEKDGRVNGGAKKMIRLLKSLKADSDNSKLITLNSYDIASLVWHFRDDALYVHPWNELSLVAAAQQELIKLLIDKEVTKQLRSPDNSRQIIDSDDKFKALIYLLLEVIDLANAVGQEVLGTDTKRTTDEILNALKSSPIF